jgi:hypothetical protein
MPSLCSALCRIIELVVGNVADDAIQREQMVAHVGEHVRLHVFRQPHQLACVLRAGHGTGGDQQGEAEHCRP